MSTFTGNIVPRADGNGTLGVSSKHWGNVFTKKVNGSEIKETPEIGAIPKAGPDGKLNDAWIGGAKAPATHTHDATSIDGLAALLALKADTSHTHTIDNVTGLQTALDGKVGPDHNHAAADISGLTTALAAKADSVHGHAITDVTGLQDALNGKAASSHTHAVADVTGLQTALDGKAASSHTHTIANVTGLQTALDGKSATSHTHSYLPLSGGTLTGILYAQNNANYTTRQARNITLSTAAPSGGGNGDVWLQY